MMSTTGPSNSALPAGGRRVRQRRSGPAPGGGFTLMELILVLAVVSVVLSLCAPSLRGFFVSRQTADAAAAMVSLTRWARSQAISQGQVCRLNVDAVSGTFWLTVQQAGAFVSLDSEIGQRISLPEGASVWLASDAPGADGSYVQFYPNGRSDVATIEIQGRGGELYQVVCPSATELFRVISPQEAPR